MTIEEIKARVEAIRNMALGRTHDNETAHSMEDDLYLDILKWIAGGHPMTDEGHMLKEIAAEAVKASEIEFTRWYA